MQQSECTQQQVQHYLEYLKEYHGLSISLHLSEEYSFEHEKIAELKAYNIHTNPYCFYIKNIRGAVSSCIACQHKILERCQKEERFTEPCHAGVLQYIRSVRIGEEAVGFICVSGYQDPNAAWRTDERYGKSLSSEEIPVPLLDVVLLPLALMISWLLTEIPRHDGGDIYTKLLVMLQNDPNISLTELAQELGCSRSYISHMFRQKSGCTLKEYCNRLKIEEAKLLLRSTDLPVTEVALSCGYNNFSYFISSFKKAVGMTPLVWRKCRTAPKQSVSY